MNLTWRDCQVVQDLVSMWDGRLPPRGVTPEELAALYARVRLLGGAREVAEERIRQQSLPEEGGEGWSAVHDDGHTDGELGRAALCYLVTAEDPSLVDEKYVNDWPFDPSWWKPRSKDDPETVDRRRCLVRAGALLEAEMERLQRLRERVLAELKGEEGD
jgi:hypothetical protein